MIERGNKRRIIKPVPKTVSRPEPILPNAARSEAKLDEANRQEEQLGEFATLQARESNSTSKSNISTKKRGRKQSKEKKVSDPSSSTHLPGYIDFFVPITPLMSEALNQVAVTYNRDAKTMLALLVKRTHETIKSDPEGHFISKLTPIEDEKFSPLWKHRVRNAHITNKHLESARSQLDPMNIELDRNLMAKIYQRLIGSSLKL